MRMCEMVSKGMVVLFLEWESMATGVRNGADLSFLCFEFPCERALVVVSFFDSFCLDCA